MFMEKNSGLVCLSPRTRNMVQKPDDKCHMKMRTIPMVSEKIISPSDMNCTVVKYEIM